MRIKSERLETREMEIEWRILSISINFVFIDQMRKRSGVVDSDIFSMSVISVIIVIIINTGIPFYSLNYYEVSEYSDGWSSWFQLEFIETDFISS